MEPVVFAADKFGFYTPFFETLTDGLIHKTYKVTANNQSAILQQVNNHVFQHPEHVVENYAVIHQHLKNNSSVIIPAPLKTINKESFWKDAEGSYWRAFEYIDNTYTEMLPATAEKIYSAAQCYAAFVQALKSLPLHQLVPTITDFHNLEFRYRQLEQAVIGATPERLNTSKILLSKIEQRKNLLQFYNCLKANKNFVLRAMHHDCKLSNILFDKTSGKALCPIDLDTTMPGYFFSDVGDMIRSMISTADENASAEAVSVNPEIYEAILSGYRDGIGNDFTATELQYLQDAGKIMLYMQAIRFLTDYLSDDVYYKINYPEQNFNRALNQLTLLERLRDF